MRRRRGRSRRKRYVTRRKRVRRNPKSRGTGRAQRVGYRM